MRLFLSFALLFILPLLSGCSSAPDDDPSCPPTNTWARVDTIDGTTVDVVLMDFSKARLHTDGADFYYIAGDVDCYEAFRSNLTPGQEIQVQVDAWDASDPPQADVDAIIIRG